MTLSRYLFILRRHLWKILSFVAGSMILTLLISLRLTPIYESTVTVDIDRSMPTGIVGQEAVQTVSNDADQFLATQIKTISSDSVLRPVALRYHLLERESAMSWWPIGRDRIDLEAPIELKNLAVKRPPNTYLLHISYRSPDRQLAADVANTVAQSYLEHTYKIRYQAAAGLSRFMEKQLTELRAKMERSSAARAKYERELSIINPEAKTNILSARLLELNSEYTKAQAERVTREAAYKSVQYGSLDAAQASDQSEVLGKIVSDLNAAEQHFDEVKTHFGPNHPEYGLAVARLQSLRRLRAQAVGSIRRQLDIEYETAAAREKMLKGAVDDTKAEFDRLNARSFQYQALKREAESDKKLYDELLRKIKEATINSSFQNSAVRISDPARPGSEPVFPRTGLNVFLAFLLSSLLAVGAAVVHDSMDDTVRDPEQVARTMNTRVIGTLPMVKSWRGRLSPAVASPNGRGGAKALMAVSASADSGVPGYEEAIRTLRNSILLADFDRQVHSLLITSASPGEGKSTTAFHLALAHAEQKHRTLLIDGDLRRPSVHKRFNAAGNVGLSNLLVSDINWTDALIKPEKHPYLHVLPAGSPSRNASDLIGQSLVDFISKVSLQYDLVILDGPPLLGFAEPLQMAMAVDGVVVVTRAGETSRKAVVSVVDTLGRLRVNVVGLVLNQVHRQISDSYYYYGYYHKYYRHRDKNQSGRDVETA